MSEQNKKLIRELWGAFEKGDFDEIANAYADSVTYHGSGGDERRGREAAVELVRMYKNAFPDLKLNVEELIADGDIVATRVRPQGTHKGELQGISPTNKRVELKWLMNMVRIRDGKIVEEWEVFDRADFLSQLGVHELAAAR